MGYVRLTGVVVTILAALGLSSAVNFWEFGRDNPDSMIIFQAIGSIRFWDKVIEVPIKVGPCMKVDYVRVQVKNLISNPAVSYKEVTNTVVIEYGVLQSSKSSYEVIAKASFICGNVERDVFNYLLPTDDLEVVVRMHPLRERACDELLNNPLLATPPPEPERPRPPRVRKPRVFKIPPRFPLLDKEFYACWCNHIKELQMLKHLVDDSAPELFPELYLKPRRLDFYARQLEHNMNVNKDLLKKINLIQRTGGYVDCWRDQLPTNKYNRLLVQQRQRNLNELLMKNKYIYSRLLVARSEQLLTKELDEEWKHTKNKLILGASLPFILFKTGKIDRDIRDPAFDKPHNVNRIKILLDIRVSGGSKIGKVTAELFNDIVPKTVELFISLLKGDANGYAYRKTRFFRIVPELYCRGGDVAKDNGYGCYLPEGEIEPMGAENYDLNHSVPGVLSMVVTPENEVCGQFNIIFKPLPQFDGKHVVFGRIVAGPMQTLERISALGLPLGTPTSECIIQNCGYFTRAGVFKEGLENTIQFPPRRKMDKL